jgi:hypothetical protein
MTDEFETVAFLPLCRYISESYRLPAGVGFSCNHEDGSYVTTTEKDAAL